jgi:hypothetical protein
MSPGNFGIAHIGNYLSKGLLVHEEGFPMMVYQEKIEPPIAPPTDDEQLKLIRESIANEDRWVRDFINRLAGVIREIKH